MKLLILLMVLSASHSLMAYTLDCTGKNWSSIGFEMQGESRLRLFVEQPVKLSLKIDEENEVASEMTIFINEQKYRSYPDHNVSFHKKDNSKKIRVVASYRKGQDRSHNVFVDIMDPKNEESGDKIVSLTNMEYSGFAPVSELFSTYMNCVKK